MTISEAKELCYGICLGASIRFERIRFTLIYSHGQFVDALEFRFRRGRHLKTFTITTREFDGPSGPLEIARRIAGLW